MQSLLIKPPKIVFDNAMRLYRNSSLNVFQLGSRKTNIDQLNKHITPILKKRFNQVYNYNLSSLNICPIKSRIILDRVTTFDAADFSLFLGEDRTDIVVSVGSFLQENKYFNPGVIWVDAYPNIHTKSPNLSKKSAAYLTGLLNEPWMNHSMEHKLDPKNLVYIGLIEIDDSEQELIERLGIKVYDVNYIEHFGIKNTILSALRYLDECGKFHVSLNFNVIENTKSISFVELMELAIEVSDNPKFISVDFTDIKTEGVELDISTDVILSFCSKYKYKNSSL